MRSECRKAFASGRAWDGGAATLKGECCTTSSTGRVNCSRGLKASRRARLRYSTKSLYSQSDRDAIDHVKIIDGIGTAQQLSEWQRVSVCKLHNREDRFRVRRAQLPRL